MSSSDKTPDRPTIIARREPQSAYASRVRASGRNTRHRIEEIVVPEGTLRRVVGETLQQELSISVSPFPTDEELATLDKYSSGSAGRMIDATIDRIESRTEVYRDNAKASRDINSRGQWFALIIAIVTLVTACYFAWLGYPIQGASVAIALVLVLAVAFLAGDNLKSVVPWLFHKNNESKPPTGDASALPELASDDSRRIGM